jgi:hypothetical protein
MKNKINELDTAMAEFLANGGVIQQGAYRESGLIEGVPRSNSWGARKPKQPAAAVIVKTDGEKE